MLVNGSTIGEISEALAKCLATGSKVDGVDLRGLRDILEYHPKDMTVTVQTGITLARLQEELSKHGQWLPIDPAKADTVTIDEVINRNLSGPRRYGYGTIREHLIGLKAVLADGRIIQNGGKVVKNVAGFDLCKLFVGARWSLGIVVEATFKLRPLPAQEIFLMQEFKTVAAAVSVTQKVIESDLTPVVLDMYSAKPPHCSVVVGLAGTAEEVEWQREKARAFGPFTLTSLDYEELFWTNPDSCDWTSVLPSSLGPEIEARKPRSFVARAGNGTIYYRGGSPPERPPAARVLNQKLKEMFDPKGVFPLQNDE